MARAMLVAGLAMAAGSAQAAHFLYTGGHELDEGSLAALGHTYTTFCQDETCWNDALSGEYGAFSAIVFGEEASVPSEAVQSAINSYVAGGGKLIFINDHSGHVKDLNWLFDYDTELVYGCKDGEDVAATLQAAAAAGTAFEGGPAELANISCTAALETASLPAGAKAFYTGESDYEYSEKPAGGAAAGASPQVSWAPTSLAWANAHGSGNVVWLGWDFCYCLDDRPASSGSVGIAADSISIRDDWYVVLDNALKYGVDPGIANLRLSFSGPATPVRNGSTAVVYARLDNYGRDRALNPLVRLEIDADYEDVSVVAPNGWSCESAGEEGEPTRIDGALYACTANNGQMPRGSLQFRLNVRAYANPSGFVGISGSASSDSADPVPGNNSASFKIYVKGGGTIAPVKAPTN